MIPLYISCPTDPTGLPIQNKNTKKTTKSGSDNTGNCPAPSSNMDIAPI